MLYRGSGDGDNFIAYIKCNDTGKAAMLKDHELRKAADLSDYGEVIYLDLIPEPDLKATIFIVKWMKESQ